MVDQVDKWTSEYMNIYSIYVKYVLREILSIGRTNCHWCDLPRHDSGSLLCIMVKKYKSVL